MKAVTVYECGICKAHHNTVEAATACEEIGPRPLIPVGTVVEDGLYVGRMFILLILAKVTHETGHTAHGWFWSFRDVKNGPSRTGDSFHPEHTNGPILGDPAYTWTTRPVNTSTARYRRAFEAMAAAGRPMYLWIDGAAVRAPVPT